jgi:hypothetical protein
LVADKSALPKEGPGRRAVQSAGRPGSWQKLFYIFSAYRPAMPVFQVKITKKMLFY